MSLRQIQSLETRQNKWPCAWDGIGCSREVSPPSSLPSTFRKVVVHQLSADFASATKIVDVPMHNLQPAGTH